MASKESKKDDITYKYIFQIETGESIEHLVELSRDTILSKLDESTPPPEWANLAYKQCKDCQLAGEAYCPVATRLSGIITKFSKFKSHQKANVTVVASKRTYFKETNIQDGLRSLFGLIMATSGCPALKPFRPMALNHLPFSSLHETIYRVVSMYLLDCFLKSKDQNFIPVALVELEDLYEVMSTINTAMAKRISQNVESNSTINAVAGLDALRYMVPLKLDESLNELRKMFA